MDLVPVSVIVPSFNSKQWLGQCVESINAGAKPAEILIVDDCSTDGSFDFAQELSKLHGNVQVKKTLVNSGAAAARKVGFSAASSDLVAIVDADDLIEKDALLDAYRKMTEDVDLCIWRLSRIDNSGKVSETTINHRKLPIAGEKAVLLTLGGWEIHPLGITRRQLYLNAYKDFSVNSFNSDELITRLLIKSARKIVGSEKKYYYRLNPDSTTQRESEKHLSIWRSNLWLISFSENIKNAPIDILVRQALSSSHEIWKKRDIYGWTRVRMELRPFVFSLAKLKPAWRFMLKHPKYFLFYSFLVLTTITGINI